MPTYNKFLASSQDNTQLSLTISSLAKVLIGIAGYYAASKGMDVASAQNQLQAIIDVSAQLVPLCFAVYHSLNVLWGLLRKFFAMFKTPQQ